MKSFYKKLTALALVLLLISSTVFSANSNGLEESILTVKSKLTIPDTLTEFDSSILQSDELTEYRLSWHDKDANNSIDVTINSLGDIIRYSSYDREYRDYTPKFASYSLDELTAAATGWLEKVNPNWLPELVLDKSSLPDAVNIYSENTSFRFKRLVNGIDFLNDGVNFSMNNITGEVRHMNANWTYAEDIEAADGILDELSAAKKYYEVSPVKLRYESDGKDSAALIYSPESPYLKINAHSGNELQLTPLYSNEKFESSDATVENSASSLAGGSKLTESELANISEINELLSQESLIKKAQALIHTNLNSASFESCSYTREYYYKGEEGSKKPIYNASLSFKFNKGTSNEYSAYVVLDAQTGALKSYRAYDYTKYYNSNENIKPKVTGADAIKTASDFIGEYANREAENVITPTPDEVTPDSQYYINFIREENDIPFPENYISVSVDSENGAVCGFNINWNENMSFESADGILDVPDAEEKIIKNIGLELSYVYSYPKDAHSNEGEIVLSYGLNTDKAVSINAKSGECISQLAIKSRIYPTDISGHYAEEQIKALISVGILNLSADDTEFRPDDTVTYRELAAMVARLTYRYDIWELSELSSFMKSNNILLQNESFEADKLALRADGPVYIIRALGYREVAELTDIYSCGFADESNIPPEKLGYVAIAKGFNIINGDENGCFNANERLSRADAAIMIYNYLAR